MDVLGDGLQARMLAYIEKWFIIRKGFYMVHKVGVTPGFTVGAFVIVEWFNNLDIIAGDQYLSLFKF